MAAPFRLVVLLLTAAHVAFGAQSEVFFQFKCGSCVSSIHTGLFSNATFSEISGTVDRVANFTKRSTDRNPPEMYSKLDITERTIYALDKYEGGRWNILRLNIDSREASGEFAGEWQEEIIYRCNTSDADCQSEAYDGVGAAFAYDPVGRCASGFGFFCGAGLCLFLLARASVKTFLIDIF